MKPYRIALSLLIVIAQIVASRAVEQNPLTPFASKDGRFKASFLKKPTHLEQSEDYNGKPVKIHYFVAEAESGGTVVMYIDLPVHFSTNEQRQRGVQSAARRGAEYAKAEIVSEQDFKFGTYPAKGVIMQTKDGQMTQCYVIIAGDRMYMVLGMSKGEPLSSPVFKRFFDSFQILG